MYELLEISDSNMDGLEKLAGIVEIAITETHLNTSASTNAF